MEKYFTNYNQSLAIKELKFDEPCMGYYKDEEFKVWNFYDPYKNSEMKAWFISAPLKSELFDWMREKHHLASWVQPLYNNESNGYFTFKIRNPDGTYVYTDAYFENYMGKGFNGYHKSHEEAEIACIDALIERVKQRL